MKTYKIIAAVAALLAVSACDDEEQRYAKLCDDDALVREQVAPLVPKAILEAAFNSTREGDGSQSNLGFVFGGLRALNAAQSLDHRTIKMINSVPSGRTGKIYLCRTTMQIQDKIGDTYQVEFTLTFNDPFGPKPSGRVDADLDSVIKDETVSKAARQTSSAAATPSAPKVPSPSEQYCASPDAKDRITKTAAPWLRDKLTGQDGQFAPLYTEMAKMGGAELNYALSSEPKVEFVKLEGASCLFIVEYPGEKKSLQAELLYDLVGDAFELLTEAPTLRKIQ